MSGKKAKSPEERPKHSIPSIVGWFIIAALAGFLTPWLLRLLRI